VAGNSRVMVARRDGSFEQNEATRLLSTLSVRPGDQVSLLSKVDEKKRSSGKA